MVSLCTFSNVRFDKRDAVWRYVNVRVQVELLQQAVRDEQRTTAELEAALFADGLDAAKASSEANVVGYDYARIERLKVEHGHRSRIELGLGLERERYAVGRSHLGLLLLAGRK